MAESRKKPKEIEYTIDDLFNPKEKDARKESLILRSRNKCKLILLLNRILKDEPSTHVPQIAELMDKDYEQTRKMMTELVRRFRLLRATTISYNGKRGSVVLYEPTFDKDSSKSRIQVLAKKIIKAKPELIGKEREDIK